MFIRTAETAKGLCLQHFGAIVKQFFNGEQVLNKMKPTVHCQDLFQSSYDTAGCEGDVNEKISLTIVHLTCLGLNKS